MTIPPLALIPLTTAAFYLGLLFLVRRRASRGLGVPEFLLYMGVLATQSIASFAWRMQGAPEGVAVPLLQLVILGGMLSAPGPRSNGPISACAGRC